MTGWPKMGDRMTLYTENGWPDDLVHEKRMTGWPCTQETDDRMTLKRSPDDHVGGSRMTSLRSTAKTGVVVGFTGILNPAVTFCLESTTVWEYVFECFVAFIVTVYLSTQLLLFMQNISILKFHSIYSLRWNFLYRFKWIWVPTAVELCWHNG